MLRTSLTLHVAPEVAFAYLSDPVNRPEWQSSLKAVEVLDAGEPHVGQRWLDRTAVGVVPRMETTALEAPTRWAETGRWRGVAADLTLTFAPHGPEGRSTRLDVAFEVRGSGLLRPVGWLSTGAGLFAVRSDLARAGRLLAERASGSA
ncbi:MAG: Polyketide cyclase / dehydrase and lipid transport [Marmoricola sp.]|nr:Polyketide cyclase / dehydrase and lipid transport [Marmoricola sp.]